MLRKTQKLINPRGLFSLAMLFFILWGCAPSNEKLFVAGNPDDEMGKASIALFSEPGPAASIELKVRELSKNANVFKGKFSSKEVLGGKPISIFLAPSEYEFSAFAYDKSSSLIGEGSTNGKIEKGKITPVKILINLKPIDVPFSKADVGVDINNYPEIESVTPLMEELSDGNLKLTLTIVASDAEGDLMSAWWEFFLNDSPISYGYQLDNDDEPFIIEIPFPAPVPADGDSIASYKGAVCDEKNACVDIAYNIKFSGDGKFDYKLDMEPVANYTYNVSVKVGKCERVSTGHLTLVTDASSANSEIASVQIDNQSGSGGVKICGVSEGTTTLTVKYTDSSDNEHTFNIQVTVTN